MSNFWLDRKGKKYYVFHTKYSTSEYELPADVDEIIGVFPEGAIPKISWWKVRKKGGKNILKVLPTPATNYRITVNYN